MKKLTYLLILLGFSICLFSCAEESQSTKGINNRAKLTKNKPKVNANSNWKKKVGLTTDQLAEINDITERIDKKRVKIPVINGKQDPNQLKVLEDYKNKKINEVLSPSQREKRAKIELAIAKKGTAKKAANKKRKGKKGTAKKAASKKRAKINAKKKKPNRAAARKKAARKKASVARKKAASKKN